ncbi:hypothetical protein [Bradyrhizobium sp. sBnM-33]|uniref:hypothetical protein n=1 Tax=Bradyrhizobium sp. sBnM-33 TaxID=2831780 RepID=UPI001BCE2121|nr:hypothetical protein [Bradyrhizobium sp. sBnM-33]WOH50560.1 hypothetical protein RX328_42235 [Bradyrhizobium sp. sBnM-33]
MSSDTEAEIRVYTYIGLCLLCIQQAERLLQKSIDTVLDNPDIRLLEQTELERKQTLGNFLRRLRRRVRLEPDVRDRLYKFLDMRNKFVHELSDIPGFDLRTEDGRQLAMEFIIELTFLALSTTILFATLYSVWAKDTYNEEFFEVEGTEAKQLLAMFEERFGTTARTILAGRSSKATSKRKGA